jgi:hypothetical protein
VNSNDHLRQAFSFTMPPKKTTAPGAALQPLDTNEETLPARSQELEEKGYQPNTSGGGVGSGDQGSRSHSPSSRKEKGKDALAG